MRPACLRRFGGVIALTLLPVAGAPGSSSAQCIDYADHLGWVTRLPTPGTARGVAVSGGHVYVADDAAGLQIVDFSTPAAPAIVASVPTSGEAWDVEVSGSHAYVADGEGLLVVNVATPSSPQVVGSVQVPGLTQDVVLSGSHAYVASGLSGMHVVDVSSPSSPTVVGSVPSLDRSHSVTLRAGLVYVADGSAGIHAVDVTVPSVPVIVGTVRPGGTQTAVTFSGNHGYVTGGTLQTWLHVIDVTAPEPVVVASISGTPRTTTALAAGNVLYLGASGFRSLDISTPDAPADLARQDGLAESSVLDIALSGSFAVVADSANGLVVMDVTSATAAPVLGYASLPSHTYWEPAYVAASGGFAYVSTGVGLEVLDVSAPSSPTVLGARSYNVFPDGESAHLVVSGNHVYIHIDQQVLVLDVWSGGSTQLVATIDDLYPCALALSGSHLLVADGVLHVVDVSSPASPVLVGSMGLPDSPTDIAVAGTYAYVGVRNTGLYVVDIATPQSPVVVGSVATPGDPRTVAVSGDHAYIGNAIGNVAAGTLEWDLLVVDVAAPAAPAIVASIKTPGSTEEMRISGNFAYLAEDRAGVQVVDLTVPTAPSFVGSADVGRISSVAVSGELVFAATGPGGDFYVLPAQCGTATAAPRPVAAGLAGGLSAWPLPLRSGQLTVAFGALHPPGQAAVTLHDVRGRLLRTLFQGGHAAGEHRISWNGRDGSGRLLSSGVYFLRLQTSGAAASIKVPVIR